MASKDWLKISEAISNAICDFFFADLGTFCKLYMFYFTFKNQHIPLLKVKKPINSQRLVLHATRLVHQDLGKKRFA
ncbi:hypothetical protein QVD17_17559 [Tagetes erecta]|uniref:Uncharacterized protein n=1 Tax=Tagetes erecta TaxID=13708 RepID=A0AAD8KSF9_TARER|nr:hypothetical protein QVD17_17559 [Tagetes erecta]